LEENPDEVLAGGANLRKQIENVLIHGVTPVVAVNAFPGDFDSEYAAIQAIADEMGVRSAVSTHFRDGGAGATDLAEAVVAAAEEPSSFRFLYPLDTSLIAKIETIATSVYGAEGVDLSPAAAANLDLFEAIGLGHLPICVAKTHLSISSDPKLKGAPTGAGLGRSRVHLRRLRGHADHARIELAPGGRADRYRRRRQRGRPLLTRRYVETLR
jgi:formate--tetrahydrofolate ligase